MESLGNSLFMDVVPESWAKRAYPSLYGLSQWYADMLQRVKELESWTGDFQLPAAVWLAGFFNPQSFLTAIMQQVNNRYKQCLSRTAPHQDSTVMQLQMYKTSVYLLSVYLLIVGNI